MAVIELGVATSQIFSYCIANLTNKSYLFCERSVEDAEPEELYLFSKIGFADYWSYTSGDSNINYNGKNYIAVLINRGDIKLDSNSLKTQLEIKTSLSNPFVRNFISESIEGTISLTIYRRHFSYYVVYWKGYVRGIIFKPNSKIAIISAGLKTSSLKRYGLMRKYQRNCGLPLYSTWCAMLKSNFEVDSGAEGINVVDGVIIDATVFGNYDTDWFKGGIFKTKNGSCLQRIVYHNKATSKIRIARSVASLAAGDEFYVYPGCDHLKDTCKTKFNNKENFGGQPYLPDKNPFVGDPVI